jgi:hypothetical protein
MAREWLPKAYRDGDVGDEPKFTKHNMEVAFSAGAAAEREACAALLEENAMHCTHPLFRSLLQANAAAIRAMGNT